MRPEGGWKYSAPENVKASHKAGPKFRLVAQYLLKLNKIHSNNISGRTEIT